MTDTGYESLLWTALRWAAAALNQAERVHASLEVVLQSRNSAIEGRVLRVTPAMERPGTIFWTDVHFLMIAVNHLDRVLEKLGAPLLDKVLASKAVELRHLLEHWDKAPQGGAWKGYHAKHGRLAQPTRLQFEPGDSGDISIGADPLSVVDLAADIRRVEKELIEIEART